MTTTFKTVPILFLIALLLLFMAMTAMNTKTDGGGHREPMCNQLTPRQEKTILEVGAMLIEGGVMHGYPISAERAVRFAFLAERGMTDAKVAMQFHIDASYLHQTVGEIRRGDCWESALKDVMVILDALKDIF